VYIAERIISLQNKNLLIIYPPPRHPRYSNLSSFSQKEFKAVEEGKKDFEMLWTDMAKTLACFTLKLKI